MLASLIAATTPSGVVVEMATVVTTGLLTAVTPRVELATVWLEPAIDSVGAVAMAPVVYMQHHSIMWAFLTEFAASQ